VSCSFGESIQIIGLIKHSHAAGDNFSVAKKKEEKISVRMLKTWHFSCLERVQINIMEVVCD
jgi:hypothetical protein